MCHHIGMVLRLEPILLVEDWQARAGLILAALEADPDAAEALLLRSRSPAAAVALRRDVQHWERALVLAQQLQPDMVGYLSCRRAQELEVAGSFDAALLHYEAALTAAPPQALQGLASPPPAGGLGVGGGNEGAYVWACQAGKARCAVHEGAVDLVWWAAAVHRTHHVDRRCHWRRAATAASSAPRWPSCWSSPTTCG